jgi:tetratricopeptide (TPR) repeat protein
MGYRTEMRGADLMVALALIGGTILCYQPVFKADFITLDDEAYASKNEHVQAGLTQETMGWAFRTFHASNWHPLTWLSLALDCQIFGDNARGHHLMNLAFHMLNALLLYGWWRAATGQTWPSALVAALFAWHPLHVESVAWIAERKDVLSAFFWLTTMWAYLWYARARLYLPPHSALSPPGGRAEDPDGPSEREGDADDGQLTRRPAVAPDARVSSGRAAVLRYVLVMLSFGLGIMSKPMVVSLPFVLLLLDFWPLGRYWPQSTGSWLPPGRLITEKLPLFAMAAGAAAITVLAQRGAVVHIEHLSIGHRVANAELSYALYLRKMIWPMDLAVIYPYPPPDAGFYLAAAVAAIILAGITIVAWTMRSTSPFFLVGWLWYLGTLVPVIGIVQVGSQAMADRYTYLPLIGIFVMVSWGATVLWHRVPASRRWVASAAGISTAALLVVTRVQAGYWQTNLTLWQHTVNVAPANPMALCNLGPALVDAGWEREGRAALMRAAELKPDMWQPVAGIGRILGKGGDYIASARAYERAIALQRRQSPGSQEAGLLNNLGNAYLMSGRPKEAALQFAQALRVDPKIGRLHASYGNALLQQGRLAEAEKEFQKALAQDGESADLLSNYAYDLKMQKRTGEADAMYRRALELDPDHLESLNNYAVLLAQHGGSLETAEKLLQRATQTHPKDAESVYNLGNVLEGAHKSREAIAYYERAVQLMPRSWMYHLRLGQALQKAGQADAAARQFEVAKQMGWSGR